MNVCEREGDTHIQHSMSKGIRMEGIKTRRVKARSGVCVYVCECSRD